MSDHDTQVIDAKKELDKLLDGPIQERIDKAMKAADEAHGKKRDELQEEVAQLKARLDAAKEARKDAESWKIKGLEIADPKNPRHFNKSAGRFSIFRYLKTLVADGRNGNKGLDLSDCGLELEVREMMIEKASQNVGAGSAGGHLVPVEMQSELIPELVARSIASQAGVRTITGLQGNMSWVRKESGVAGGYLDTEAEASITEETLTFATVTASPKPLGAAVGITWLAMRQPAISMEAIVRQDLVEKLALLKDDSIFQGSGASGAPRGIANTPGITSVTDWGATGFTFGGSGDDSIAALRAHYHALRESNALGDGSSLGWVMEPDAAFKLEKTLDADGRPLYVGLQEPAIQRAIGFPVLTSTQLDQADADAFVLFGKFNECIDANWGTIELAVTDSNSSDFLKGRVVVRAIMQHDVAVRQPSAFALASSFNAA